MALLAEERRLITILHNEDNSDAIDKAIANISGLEVFYEVQKLDYSDPFKIGVSVQTNLWLDRWRSSRFYFSDGGESNPFP